MRNVCIGDGAINYVEIEKTDYGTSILKLNKNVRNANPNFYLTFYSFDEAITYNSEIISDINNYRFNKWKPRFKFNGSSIISTKLSININYNNGIIELKATENDAEDAIYYLLEMIRETSSPDNYKVPNELSELCKNPGKFNGTKIEAIQLNSKTRIKNLIFNPMTISHNNKIYPILHLEYMAEFDCDNCIFYKKFNVDTGNCTNLVSEFYQGLYNMFRN